MAFTVGQKVTWTSQSQGNSATKVGYVVLVVPPGRRVREGEIGGGFPGGPRNHESYIVEVKTSKNLKAKGKRYWPRVSALQPVVE